MIVLSKVVFPVYVPKCLKGTNARRKQQLAFKESENPATTAKRDHAGQNVSLREREPQEINEVHKLLTLELFLTTELFLTHTAWGVFSH